MRSVPRQPWSNRSESPLRRRTIALVLVFAAHALLVFMLLRLAPPPSGSGAEVTAIELLPDIKERTRAAVEPKPARSERRKSPVRQQHERPTPPVVDQPYKLDIIELTPRDYAASNIARLPTRQRAAPSSDAAAESASSASADSASRGSGPNGERLYEADWYRKPTQAELAFYLPRGAVPVGWATIACQTVDDYRVDNCVELEESPAGSGLATAINKAAWQFRVWPPRLGGRPLVGAWVRIRIEFMEDRTN